MRFLGLPSQRPPQGATDAHVWISCQAFAEVGGFAVFSPQGCGEASNCPSLASKERQVVLHCVAEHLYCDGGPIIYFLARTSSIKWLGGITNWRI